MAVLTHRSQPRVSVAGHTFTPRLPRKTLGAAVGAVVAGLVFSDSQAQALVVTVSGLDYEVSTFYGSYNDNIGKFETEANGGVMPWWGSQFLASELASAVGDKLGLPNLGPLSGTVGPIFGFADENYTSVGLATYYYVATASPPVHPYVGIYGAFNWQQFDTNYTWAIATSVPAAGSANVPGPLPAVGLAVAFGFSRQLRKRITLHKGTSAVSTPPGA